MMPPKRKEVATQQKTAPVEKRMRKKDTVVLNDSETDMSETMRIASQDFVDTG